MPLFRFGCKSRTIILAMQAFAAKVWGLAGAREARATAKTVAGETGAGGPF